MRLTLLAAACMAYLASLAQAQQTVINDHCPDGEGQHGSLRQTVVIVDGAIISEDGEDGPSAENQEWRRFASTFIDASSPLVSQLLGPRERVTIAIANADGSGLTPIFTGCVPLVSEEEARLLDQETSTLDEFFGRDWRSLNEKAATAFARAARLALIRGTAEAIVGKPARTQTFAQGSLVASLRNSPGFDLSDGLVRYVILSDLGLYDVQKTDIETARANGFRDAENASLAPSRLLKKCLVGRQALEIEFLKGALKHGQRPGNATTSVITGPGASPSRRMSSDGNRALDLLRPVGRELRRHRPRRTDGSDLRQLRGLWLSPHAGRATSAGYGRQPQETATPDARA